MDIAIGVVIAVVMLGAVVLGAINIFRKTPSSVGEITKPLTDVIARLHEHAEHQHDEHERHTIAAAEAAAHAVGASRERDHARAVAERIAALTVA